MNETSLSAMYPQPVVPRFSHWCSGFTRISKDCASSLVQSSSEYIIKPLKSH